MTRTLPAVLAALALALPVLARAENGPPPGDKAGGDKGGKHRLHELDPKEVSAKMSERLNESLELTDDQAKKVKAILERDAPEQVELMKKLHANERKTHEAIRALLNDEQKERFDMMRAHMMMGGMRGRKRGPRGPEGDMHGPPPQDSSDEDGRKGPPPHDEDD